MTIDKNPFREALDILDKHAEKSVFYNEVFKDKEKDSHVQFALNQFDTRAEQFQFLTKYCKLNEDGLYIHTLNKSIGDRNIQFAGKYFYNIIGYLHNDKGAAVVTQNGTEMYFNNGELHNQNGPAVIFKDPEKDFKVYIHYIKNTLDRENGPAKEVWQDGKLYKSSYYINGKLHREDGPAIEWSDGQYIYAVNGEKHKEDGPAVRIKNPLKEGKYIEEYWINGEQISSIEFKLKQMREKFFPKTQSENKLEGK